MEIHIGADHNGFELKNELKKWLEAKGHTVVDAGPTEFDKGDDYPDFGYEVAKAVGAQPDKRRGIAICGSGVGMSVVADKVKGVRAALIHDPDIARAAQRDDDINVLALGSQYISPNKAKEVVEAWLSTSFSGEERHKRRIGKISEYEQR
jgi:ribose 5-phosphate isomerase B